MPLPLRMPMAGRTTSLTIRSTTTSGTESTWPEITPLPSPTISSTKTVRPPDPPAVDLALEERAPAIRNFWGSRCAATSSAVTLLARSTDLFWTPPTPVISPHREVKEQESVHLRVAICRRISSETSAVPTSYPTHRTMTLVCARIHLPSMSGWTRGHLDSIRPLIRSLRPTSRSKPFVRRMEMRIGWHPSMPEHSSFPTCRRLPMRVLIKPYLEVSLLPSMGAKEVILKEQR